MVGSLVNSSHPHNVLPVWWPLRRPTSPNVRSSVPSVSSPVARRFKIRMKQMEIDIDVNRIRFADLHVPWRLQMCALKQLSVLLLDDLNMLKLPRFNNCKTELSHVVSVLTSAFHLLFFTSLPSSHLCMSFRPWSWPHHWARSSPQVLSSP